MENRLGGAHAEAETSADSRVGVTRRALLQELLHTEHPETDSLREKEDTSQLLEALGRDGV